MYVCILPYLTGDEWVEEVSGELGLQARSLRKFRPRRLAHVQEGDGRGDVNALGLAPGGNHVIDYRPARCPGLPVITGQPSAQVYL